MTAVTTGRVDARGLACPMPTIRLAQAIRKIDIGGSIEMWTDDRGSEQNMPAWCKNTGHELVGVTIEDGTHKYTVRRKR